MACIDANGNITRSAELILLAVMKPVSVERVAAESGLAVFRIRAALRELTQAGLILQTAGTFQITEEGQKALEGRRDKEES
jgi:predicted transcriptional regulator